MPIDKKSIPARELFKELYGVDGDFDSFNVKPPTKEEKEKSLADFRAGLKEVEKWIDKGPFSGRFSAK
jgi:hypothetical protein